MEMTRKQVPDRRRRARRVARFGLGYLATLCVVAVVAPALLADDCARDWRRAED
jgi:hypothetical protein